MHRLHASLALLFILSASLPSQTLSESRNGPALVLISGGPGISHDYFHPYFSSLANSCRVVYFEALGRGKSDRAKSVHEYSSLAMSMILKGCAKPSVSAG
jgi:pimeloyl-ACP methyl ester carboxylesterase